jgi:xanthine dehydrogenase accessory factor
MPDLQNFLRGNPSIICAELASVRGSSPREAGTAMLVGRHGVFGTIGGGALEYMVIERARRMIGRAEAQAVDMDVPLGPEIGQCCGGRVAVRLRVFGDAEAARFAASLADEAAHRPVVMVYGAGHVGRALARCLALLPVRVTVIDTRPDEIAELGGICETRVSAMPESEARNAPDGASHVIVTHDHALDFLIAAEALARTDAPYVGMVGSVSKRGRFSSWFRETGGSAAALERLVLPIGAMGLGDKRPEVIAAFTAAEVMRAIGTKKQHGADRGAMSHG